eukprot:IDg20798t1
MDLMPFELTWAKRWCQRSRLATRAESEEIDDEVQSKVYRPLIKVLVANTFLSDFRVKVAMSSNNV